MKLDMLILDFAEERGGVLLPPDFPRAHEYQQTHATQVNMFPQIGAI